VRGGAAGARSVGSRRVTARSVGPRRHRGLEGEVERISVGGMPAVTDAGLHWAGVRVIASVGVDIIEIERIRRALERHPRMAERLFTETERAYCEARGDPASHYAARFAAKEATAKAVGRWLRWQDIEVINDESGRPRIELYGEAAARARTSGGMGVLVSLSHSREHAVACVLLVGPQEIASPDENLPPGRIRT
jgi:holo-[acyl-carrier protein] synthase